MPDFKAKSCPTSCTVLYGMGEHDAEAVMNGAFCQPGVTSCAGQHWCDPHPHLEKKQPKSDPLATAVLLRNPLSHDRNHVNRRFKSPLGGWPNAWPTRLGNKALSREGGFCHTLLLGSWLVIKYDDHEGVEQLRVPGTRRLEVKKGYG